ncbi:hypothetical protein NIES4071_57680 [Calothrix sp. NIES-4071]|nr:hypothetical protein NIES4071_57680 [Calothrix sp. NIES-4071]BAZ60075.1 hypothetical protein NIES4105_57630 [Calothrix sp. NIES-4105]
MKKSIIITGIAFFITGMGVNEVIANAQTNTTKPTTNTQTTTPANLPKITPAAKSNIELLSAGREPRQELRIKPR